MTVLLDLPNEIIFRIVELVNHPTDAVALTQACRSLNALSGSLAFWRSIARQLGGIHPLPLAPFKTFDTLSLSEIRDVCAHHTKLHRNLLRQPNPTVRRHAIVRLDPAWWSPVYHFAFLPGGRYIILLLRNGLFSCWDTGATSSSGQGEPQTTGRQLAEFRGDLSPMSWNFEVYPERREVMIVIVSVHKEGGSLLNVLVLTWTSDDEVRLDHLCRSYTPISCERIHIQGDVVCGTGPLAFGESRMMVLLDVTTFRSITLDTGLKEERPTYDSFAAAPDGVMLYRETHEVATTHYYMNLKQLIADKSKTPDGQLSMFLRRPDFSETFTFHPTGNFSHQYEELFVTHPWNTPTFPRDRAVSIMTTSRGLGWRPNADMSEELLAQFEDNSFRTLTHHWFVPPSMRGTNGVDGSGSTPTPAPSNPARSLRRWVHHVPDTIEVGIDMNDLICPGSHGTHLLWIWGDPHLVRENGEVHLNFNARMHIANMFPPLEGHEDDDGDKPLEVQVRELLVDKDVIDLGSVAITDVEDAHGIVGLVMRPTEDRQTTIHLLYY